MRHAEPPRENSVRLGDVARYAGVSITTASHTFSGRRPVSATTRAKVLQAAFDLGFTTGSESKTKVVGLLLRPPEAVPGFNFGTASFANLAGAVMVALLGHGFSVVTFNRLKELGGQIDAIDAFILLYPNREDAVLKELIERKTPTVTYDPDPGLRNFPWWVGVDYPDSSQRLITHMIDRGARQIALVIGQTENMYMASIGNTYHSEMQVRGLRPMMRKANDGHGHAGGREAAISLFNSTSPPDAIITSSSVFASGVLAAADEAGLNVPDDLMLATMTDGPLSENARVPITALRTDTNSSASRLVKLAVARIGGSEAPTSRIWIALELVERPSTFRRKSSRTER